MFLSAEERPWWDAKLLHSFAVVGSSGKTAQPGICHSSMEAGSMVQGWVKVSGIASAALTLVSNMHKGSLQ